MIQDNNKRSLIECLCNVWELYPHYRFWQLLSNSLYNKEELQFISDSKVKLRLEELASSFAWEPE